jgi:hypothetical protein
MRSTAARRFGRAPQQLVADRERHRRPKRTFKDQMTLGSGNDRIEIHYYGRAHTGYRDVPMVGDGSDVIVARKKRSGTDAWSQARRRSCSAFYRSR